MRLSTNPLSFFDPPPSINGEPSRPSSSNYTETTSPSSAGDPLVRTPSNHFLHFPTLAEIMSAGLGDNALDNKSTPEEGQLGANPSTFLSSYYSDSSREPLVTTRNGSGSGSPAVQGDNPVPASSLDWVNSFESWPQGSSSRSGATGLKGDSMDGVEMSASKSNREKTSTGIWQDLGHHPIPINIDTDHSQLPSNPEQPGANEEDAFLSFLRDGLDRRKQGQEGDASSDPFAPLQPRLPTPNSSQSHSTSPFPSDPSGVWANQRYPLPGTFGSTSSPIDPPSTQVPINTLSPQSLQIPQSSTPTSNTLGPGAMPAPYSSTSTSPLRLPSILPPLPSSQSPYHRYHDPLSLHDPRPASAGYPVNLFGNVPLPEMENNWQGGGGSHMMLGQGETQMSGADYAQAVALYEHILAAMSHVQPSSASSSSTDGMPFDSLLQMSDQGVDLLSGTDTSLPSHRSPGRPPSPGSSKPKSPIKSSGQGRKTGGHDKGKVTKCLGCGSTSTPEWRRGPLGPRTLCNACGLVHMKLQRKKRKAEEKAAAAEAAAKAAQGQGPSGSAR